MNVDLAQELLNELGSSLENLETQHGALLQFMKDNGTLTDDQFAPYLAQAGKASSVRWRAARIRLDGLFSTERQKEKKLEEKEQRRAKAEQAASQNQEREAKPEEDAGTAAAAPQSQEAKTNRAVEGDGGQSSAEKDSKPVEPATSVIKESSPTSKST